jgi:hypothetical protein
MSLNLLVPSLLRVNVASSASAPHPLHGLMEPLLHTVRSASNKYHVELPQILADEGGAGEMEEEMMWYALNHEKGDGGEDGISLNGSNLWTNDKWKSKWLQRLERREYVSLSFFWLFSSFERRVLDRLTSLS